MFFFNPLPFLIFDDQISGLDRVKFYKSPFVVTKLYHLTAAETDIRCPTHITPQLSRNGSPPATLFSGLIGYSWSQEDQHCSQASREIGQLLVKGKLSLP